MMVVIDAPDATAACYDCLAPFYDRFTAGYAHEPWVAAIEEHAAELGCSGARALDLACGTGNSTLPLLERGYSVLACDISEAMICEARGKLPGHADVFFVADMRDLPDLGEFDLILCLDDAINYLLGQADLDAAFAAVARSLAPDGVFAFDVNSLLTYRTSFAETFVSEADGVFFAWRGEGSSDLAPGALAAASIEVFSEGEDGFWERRASRHLQRHHTRETILESLRRAGLDCCGILGQHRGSRLEASADEDRHIKLVYFARVAGGQGARSARAVRRFV
jgi:SAM-dependent methyltransferase